MSITWYKLKIKKQTNEYECYIRFKFDFQMQSIKIKSFIYLTDSEGNIVVTEKKNKLGYDPRILGSLTVEKNFLNQKRKNNINNKQLYYEVMKYQGNFNICNLPLIDDYFRNGKALIYQYKNMIYLMDNKKYKIQMTPKIFTIILDVINYGFIPLNLFNKLEDVQKQELIFLQQNEDALCHRYISNKYHGVSKNKKDADEIEIIEENKNFNQLGGRICIGGENNNNINIDEEKDKKEGEEILNKLYDENENYYDINSENSSIYDYNFLNGKNEKLIINNNKFFINDKDFSKGIQNCNVILNWNSNSSKKNNKSKSKNKFSNFNINNNISNIINNNENYNNFFIKLYKEDHNFSNYSESNTKTNGNSAKKELNIFENDKNIFSKYNLEIEINNNNQKINSSSKKFNQNQFLNICNNNNNVNNINIFSKNIIPQKVVDSLISNEAERKILLCSSGFDNTKYTLTLLYKSTLHGDNLLDFHKRCDNKKNIFLIILTLDNKKFGFYTSIGLSINKNIVYDNNAFLFKLSNSEMDCFHIKNKEIALYCKNDYILYLGGDQLIIKDKFLSGASSCGCKMKNYKINSNYQINNGNKNFIIKELEVYIISEI